MTAIVEDLKKFKRHFFPSQWETSYDEKLLPDGKYLENLAICRKTVEAEIGHEKWKEIHKPNKFLDIFICLALPTIGWSCMFITFNHTMKEPIFWIAALIHSWTLLCSFLAYHDIIAHRCSFGVWGSYFIGYYMASHGMLHNGLNTFWGARHTMTHHKYTFEKVDCDLSGHDMKSRFTRFLFIHGAIRQFIRLQFWMRMDNKYNTKNFVNWFPGPLGKTKQLHVKLDSINRILKNILTFVLVYHYPVETLRMLLVPQTLMGIWDNVRYVFEHSEHDRHNPYWHAVLYKTNPVVRFLWMGEIGDCHSVHHIFPRVPLYNMGKATEAVNPVLIKHGVRLRPSFWEIMYGYYILCLPHGTRWDNLDWYGQNGKKSL